MSNENQPRPRLPERDAEILAPGSKLKFILNEKGELTISGNRLGLRALAAICSGPSEGAGGDHYHLDEHFWGTEPGSIPVVGTDPTDCERHRSGIIDETGHYTL